MKSVVVLAVAVACVPQQQQPSYYTQQQQQPGYAQDPNAPQQPYPSQEYQQPQQPYPPQAQPRAATCGQVVGCYLDCKAAECDQCESGVDANVVAAARAITQCSLGHQCQDSACTQTQCGRELAACTGQQPGSTVVAQPVPAAPVGTTAPYRILMGKKFLTSGWGSSRNRQPKWYVLFDNGRILGSLPFNGLSGVDDRVADGTYVDNGNSIQTPSSTFNRGSDGMWQNGEGEFWMVDALDNAVLEGTFRSPSGQPIAFSRDGRFQSAQLFFIDSNIQTGTREIPAGTGTYRILRNTLMLSFSTGQVIWIGITSLDTRQFPSPSTIYLAFDLFQRA